ncbi:MAG: hypothetical protein ACXADA_17945 [Candidatus Hodarchaeales archaeon]|jgi:hypothetical protein
MSNIRKMVILFVFAFLIAGIPATSILSTVNQTPIIPVEDIEDTYIPVTHDTWDYYLLPPGTSYENVEYWGTSTNQAYYTTAGTNGYGTSGGVSLTRGNTVPTSMRRNTSRGGNHDFFESIPYPRAARIASDQNPELKQVMTSPLNLHMNYSSTFFAEESVVYWGYVESDNPFYLDVAFSATNVMGLLTVESAYPETGHLVGIPENKMTYPFFPKNEGVHMFMFVALNGTTLVTLTPHSWGYPTWLPTLDVNTVNTGDLAQGSPWYKNTTTDQLIKPDNEVFSIRMFNLSLVAGEYYRINALFDMEDIRPGVPSSEPVIFLVGDHYESISGDIDQDGMLIRAHESETATLVLYSPGEANGQYTIFYRVDSPPTMMETRPLVLGTDILLEEDIYYTFTFTAPTMMQANWTSPFTYDIYKEGSEPGEWIQISDEGFLGDGDPWRYIPPGVYALEVINFNVGEEIRFTTLPVQSPSSSPFSVNNETMLAIELPLARNRINWVNVSTADEINQTVTYDYIIASKYNEFIPAATDTVTLGNQQDNGSWIEWPGETNNTWIEEYLPTRDYQAPILIIYPDSAWNGTDTLTSYSATLTVTTGIAFDESSTSRSLGFYGGDDGFIPTGAISSTTVFTVNDDTTTDNDQVFGIPLSLSSYKIYNVTVYLVGNYSTGISLNATLNDIDIHGRNYNNLAIFSSETGTMENDTMGWRSTHILTASDTSYLYIDLRRSTVSVYLNATLIVSIEQLPFTNLEFDLDTTYDPTPSEQEVFTDDPIVNEIIPIEMMSEILAEQPPFPFEVIAIVGGGVVIAAVGSGTFYFWRKRSRGY